MNPENKITQSQKMMVFVLSMSLYGLATLFTELIPSFQVGVVEFSVEYFLFIPLTLAMLFDPLSAALGAATGELVFSEIMLGQFGGLGELEKFLTVTIGVYIAGRLVKNPKNRKMVAAASILGVTIQQLMGCVVDILKVQFAVEDFEAVAGLPESVFFTEGFACLNDILFSGILFCMLPADHPLAARASVTIEDLANESIVAYDQGRNLDRCVLEMFASRGVVPNIIEYTDEWASLFSLVALGKGAAIFPLMPFDATLVTPVPIDHPMHIRDVYMMWPSDRKLPAYVEYLSLIHI